MLPGQGCGHLERGGGTQSSSQAFACWSFSEITPGNFSSSLFLFIQAGIFGSPLPLNEPSTFLPHPDSAVPEHPLVQLCAWPEALHEDMASVCISLMDAASYGKAGGRVFDEEKSTN